ncbi:hypothetical protein LXL04_028350 [Taraxacum kok-saghyz]
MQIVECIPDAIACQLDVMDHDSFYKYINQVDIVISLLPPSFHSTIANVCIEVFYVNDSMYKLHEAAKDCDITLLGEMGLDPGIGHFSFSFSFSFVLIMSLFI